LSHRASKRFWRGFEQLPVSIQQLARRHFELLKSNPKHPSLHFKRIGRHWSVRITRSYRAIGVDTAKGIYWLWIGPHDEYDQKFDLSL
jgi:hypothetical protein